MKFQGDEEPSLSTTRSRLTEAKCVQSLSSTPNREWKSNSHLFQMLTTDYDLGVWGMSSCFFHATGEEPSERTARPFWSKAIPGGGGGGGGGGGVTTNSQGWRSEGLMSWTDARKDQGSRLHTELNNHEPKPEDDQTQQPETLDYPHHRWVMKHTPATQNFGRSKHRYLPQSETRILNFYRRTSPRKFRGGFWGFVNDETLVCPSLDISHLYQPRIRWRHLPDSPT